MDDLDDDEVEEQPDEILFAVEPPQTVTPQPNRIVISSKETEPVSNWEMAIIISCLVVPLNMMFIGIALTQNR